MLVIFDDEPVFSQPWNLFHQTFVISNQVGQLLPRLCKEERVLVEKILETLHALCQEWGLRWAVRRRLAPFTLDVSSNEVVLANELLVKIFEGL